MRERRSTTEWRVCCRIVAPQSVLQANIEGQCLPSVRREFANASVQERLRCEILRRRHLDEDQASIRVIKRVRNNGIQRPISPPSRQTPKLSTQMVLVICSHREPDWQPWSTNLQVTRAVEPNLSLMATKLLSPALVRTRCRCTLCHSDDTYREGHRQGHRSRFKRCCAEPDGSEKTPGRLGSGNNEEDQRQPGGILV